MNYDKLKEIIIKSCIEGKLYLEVEDTNLDNVRNLLNSIFNTPINEEIKSFKKTMTDYFNIYEYSTVNLEGNNIKENYLVCKDNIPIIKLEKMNKGIKNIISSNETFTIYHNNTNRIRSRINIKSVKVDNVEDIHINILSSDNINKNEYFKKNYRFMLNEDDIVFMEIDNSVFTSEDGSFSLRRDGAILCIKKVFNEIEKSIDKLNGDSIKEYNISRKRN